MARIRSLGAVVVPGAGQGRRILSANFRETVLRGRPVLADAYAPPARSTLFFAPGPNPMPSLAEASMIFQSNSSVLVVSVMLQLCAKLVTATLHESLGPAGQLIADPVGSQEKYSIVASTR
jgi:hypothetical protein